MVVIIKPIYLSDIRRFVMSAPSLGALRLHMCSTYSLPSCVLVYKDQGGNDVTLTSTDDLQYALASAKAQASAGDGLAVLHIRVLRPAPEVQISLARGTSAQVVGVLVHSALTAASSVRTPRTL